MRTIEDLRGMPPESGYPPRTVTKNDKAMRRSGKIVADRESFLRRLATDREMQRALLLLPDRLIGDADRLLGRWSELRPGRRMQCLRLAIAACQTALLLRRL